MPNKTVSRPDVTLSGEPAYVDEMVAMMERMFARPKPSGPRPTLQQQQRDFVLADTMQAAPNGWRALRVAPAPQAPSAADRALGERLQKRPQDVLESIYFARWSSDGAYGDELLTPALRPRFAARKRAVGGAAAPGPHAEAARHNEVFPLRALQECTQGYCALNRFMQPQRRLNVDRRIAERVDGLFGDKGAVLRMAFVNSGGLFTEVACLQQLQARGFRRVELHVVHRLSKPTIALARGEDMGDEVSAGYDVAFHQTQVNMFAQAAGWLATMFDEAALLVYADGDDLLATAERGQLPFHLFAALDPGLDGCDVQRARDEVTRLRARLGAPNALEVAFWPDGSTGKLAMRAVGGS